MKWIRRALTAAPFAFALVLLSTSSPAHATTIEGCTVLPGESCSYVATAPGNVTGLGSFDVAIRRGDTVFHVHNWSLVTNESGIVLPGDVVTVRVPLCICPCCLFLPFAHVGPAAF